MKEYPKLLIAEMVRAIKEGHKTQTREPLVPQPTEPWFDTSANPPTWYDGIREICPWQPGDHFWVRETYWQAYGTTLDLDGETRMVKTEGIRYIEELDKGGWDDDHRCWVKKPSIFMPKEICRIRLEITRVRIERVASISEEDAKAEGVKPMTWQSHPEWTDYRVMFWTLWDQLYKKRGLDWDANPWVRVADFKVI